MGGGPYCGAILCLVLLPPSFCSLLGSALKCPSTDTQLLCSSPIHGWHTVKDSQSIAQFGANISSWSTTVSSHWGIFLFENSSCRRKSFLMSSRTCDLYLGTSKFQFLIHQSQLWQKKKRDIRILHLIQGERPRNFRLLDIFGRSVFQMPKLSLKQGSTTYWCTLGRERVADLLQQYGFKVEFSTPAHSSQPI